MQKKEILAVFLTILSLVPFVVLAQIEIPNPLKYETLEELVEAIIGIIFYLSLAVVPLMVVIAAFFILTAGGDPNRVKTGQKIMLYTVIGFATILVAKGIISLLRFILGIPPD